MKGLEVAEEERDSRPAFGLEVLSVARVALAGVCSAMTAVDAAKRMAQANFDKVKNGSANALVALAVRNFDDAAIDAHAGNAADAPAIYAKYWFALL